FRCIHVFVDLQALARVINSLVELQLVVAQVRQRAVQRGGVDVRLSVARRHARERSLQDRTSARELPALTEYDAVVYASPDDVWMVWAESIRGDLQCALS